MAARYRERHPEASSIPLYIKIATFINPHDFGLKEHSIAAITAASASQGSLSIVTFTVQRLFYEGNPLSAATVILSALSIALFGYGLTGLLRPVTVWGEFSHLRLENEAILMIECSSISTGSCILVQHPPSHNTPESPLGRCPIFEKAPYLLVLPRWNGALPAATSLYYALAQLRIHPMSRVAKSYGREGEPVDELVWRKSE